jgi:eukaryotic-like serine/threonine-protein kinase
LTLVPGTRVGVYEITAQIGEGGMGAVYRATDTSLGRQVAIKVLPDAFASDPERVARFEREARTLASLNHPHIAGIYGFEKSSGMHALVLELVEGDDLSHRIARGAIPLDDALPIAKQIAEALEAAHELGIIHRDLKPANIKIRGDGTAKILDFGLAKAVEPPTGWSPDVFQSPTITRSGMTRAGMILGTAAYMAPEQARGRTVDSRADIWAFGAVLFEMVTGTRAFGGENVMDTFVSVISKEPDWSAVSAATPAGLRRLLARCLKKDARTRLQAIGDARAQIDELLSGAREDAGDAMTDATSAGGRGRRLVLAALAVAAALVAAMAMPTLRHLRETSPPALPEMRVEIMTPATDMPLQFALSPDGRHIVFVASGDRSARLWLRALDDTEARPLAGTEGATYPFWSPDSRSVGYFAQSRLVRLDIAGGAPDVLATLTGISSGGSWSDTGTILFARQTVGPLWRVAALGGEPVPVTALDPPRQISHRQPHFLPDGRQFLFLAEGVPEAAGLYLGSLEGGVPRRLTATDSGGAFVPPDRVVFVRQGALVARRLDLALGALTGDPETLADGVGWERYGRGGFAVSGSGLVAYRAGGDASRQLTWVDRTGKPLGVAGEPDANDQQYTELSSDGRRVAMQRSVQGNGDIWLLDLLRTGSTRLTFDPADEAAPTWSPDGRQIAFASNRTGPYNLHVKASNGLGAEERLGPQATNTAPQDWSPDGRWLLYSEVHPTTGRDLWALDMAATGRTPHMVATTRAEETMAEFSPNGRWVAYQSNESSRFEVVVQPFPDASGKWQVSTSGGVAPRWRADGRELYFLAPDGTMMAAPVSAAGTSFEVGTPEALFPTRIVEGGSTRNQPQYDLSRDGRFLINQPVQDATTAPITLLLNWNPAAKK